MRRLLETTLWRLRGRPVPATWRLHVPTCAGLRYNEVLPDEDAVRSSIEALSWEHPTRVKTWDFLKATHYLKEHFPDRSARILDFGCVGSPILEWLYGQDYRYLYGTDLVAEGLPSVPVLRFHQGDIATSGFEDDFFDVISCISVIEHGVDLDAFLSETSRLIKPNGALLISTDYNEPKIDTTDVPRSTTFNLPWTIFDRSEVEQFVDSAQSRHGFRLVEPICWEMAEAPVLWNGMQYSFVFLAMRKG